MNIFRHLDYRPALRETLAELKKKGRANAAADFADAMGVQRTFVSKVLNDSAHLSSDQFYLALQFFKLSQRELDYLKLVYDYSRSGLHARQAELLLEIREIQEEQRQFRVHTRAEMQSPEHQVNLDQLYLDPLNLLVHAYLGVDRFANSPQELLSVLDISSARLKGVLDCLQEHKIIKLSPSGTVKMLKKALHLDINSIYCRPYQSLLRTQSTEQIMRLKPDRRFVLTLTFAANHETKGRIQELYLEFMKKVEDELDAGVGEDDVYQINFDLFPWGKG